MILDRTVMLNYTNERGLSVPLVPYVANPRDGVFYITYADDPISNDIKSERQAGWHGSNVQGFYMGDRFVEIDGFIQWDSRNPNLIHQYKRALERTINPDLSGRLTYSRKGSKKEFFLDCIPQATVKTSVGNGVLNFNISLVASNPFWQQRMELVRLSFTQKNMYFPMSIRPKHFIGGIVPKENKTYFGLKQSNLRTTIDNIGDVESGFRLVFIANGKVENPSLTNLDTNQTLKIVGLKQANFVMEKGDTIEIINMPKERNVKIKDNDRAVRYLAPGSEFFNLPVGPTNLSFNADMNVSLLDVLLYYTPMYLGAEG